MRIGPKANCTASLAVVFLHQAIGRTVWWMGALSSSDGATLVRRGLLALGLGLVTTRAGLRRPQSARSASAPVGCRWPGRPVVLLIYFARTIHHEKVAESEPGAPA